MRKAHYVFLCIQIQHAISAYTNYYTNTSHVFGIVGPAIMQKADPHT